MVKFAQMAAAIFIIGVVIAVLNDNMEGWINEVWTHVWGLFKGWMGPGTA
ncbi:hypothetical protein [Paenibacillus mucilaginosus]|uniref:Uncharacterized protein n=3 Tax=Paenibacillus mucilaginosus TaxID=61624 RepID=H6NRQ2_9BACL|nr:hypothetical protein [Paenibacillus mucilaginosus]AEI39035.1 hypothetical protein KNP414_00410 [Paenibacillus mucilaginosus KNP414]AFC27334.1 hypothetical protein PM3016_358 [Paenibacillus mucilaginosus 3016]AFH59478.1 hypothetical protein B2K_01835 [Paenibacillus mucilaginosus K02]MCG7216169.1 hypothetical protein [Paenibacillus mucilaginosus]WDM28073.1 hypothetical protein KCX80_01965 [Paenibacillus mucilaginosus]